MSSAASLEVVTRTIGPYELLREIGRGGMGVVYRARRAKGGAEVALKIANAEVADLFGCMRREIHALSRLRHPGVVRIIEEGVERGIPWYAMELLEARPLADVLALGDDRDPEMTDAFGRPQIHARTMELPSARTHLVRADLRRALTLMYRLARVLSFVHSHGIVHRDLKPYNVLVRRDDTPVLVDFGLMGQFRAAESGREVLEIGGLMMGTAMYVAPEQASGELVDARADLYAFGVMLYEIVTGRPPFSGTSMPLLLQAHRLTQPLQPSMIVNGVPPALESLILQLLEKRPADRLGYADDVAALLVEAGAEPDRDDEAQPQAAYLYRPEILGRKDTLAALRKLLPPLSMPEAAVRGAFVTLGGESGIGKTSVATAFAREATIANVTVVTGECIPVATTGSAIGGQPLHPFRPLLSTIADHCLALGGRAFERVLGPRIAVLREYEPTLAAIADRTPDGALRLPSEVVQRRLFGDLAETLAEFAREKPLLLILDDLQWADEVTLRFLSSLDREFFDSVPLAILGTYRADEVGPDLRDLLAHEHITRIALSRLDDESIAAIVRSMLAEPNASADFLGFLTKQSEGNPFFVTEYLRAAVAERLLYREGGRWRVKGATETSYSSLGLPGTLRDLVGRRLDGLSPLARRVAEVAAVLGREVSESLLISASPDSETDAMDAITELLEHFVFDPVESGVRFAHDKLREITYARLSDDRRIALHARAAAAIEEHCENDEMLRMHAAELAHHWDKADHAQKAIRYYSWAGESSVRTGACREATEQLLRAIELDELDTRDRGDGEATRRRIRRARWHRLLSAARFGLGDLRGCSEHAKTGLEYVGISLPSSQLGWTMRVLQEVARQALHVALPRRLYRARAAKLPILAEAAMSAERFSERSFFTNDLLAMIATGLIAVNEAERSGDTPDVVRAYSMLGLIAGSTGVNSLADRYFAEGRRLAEQAGDLAGIAHVGYASVTYYVGICDWKRGALRADESVETVKRTGDLQELEIAETARGHLQFYTGGIADAAETYARVRDMAHKRSNRQHESWALFGRARSLILMGFLDEALEGIDAARVLVEGQNDRVCDLLSHAHGVHALMHRGDLERAVELADITYAIASRGRPVMFEMFRGYSAPAEVYLEVWSRARGSDPLEVKRMRRAVKALVGDLASLARRAPIALPIMYRIAGIAHCLDGNMRRGERLLRKSAATAAKLGLPIDEGIAEYELVQRADLDLRERALHREKARAIFRRIGCDLYLRKMRDDPRRSDTFRGVLDESLR